MNTLSTIASIAALFLVCSSVMADPIHDAARKGDIKKVEVLMMGNRAIVNSQDILQGELAPLHIAVETKNKPLAELLLANGADVNIRKTDGTTPLHIAAEKGSKEMAELLLAKKADANVATRTGKTPLHLAAVSENAEVAELLLLKGAKIDPKDNDGMTPLHRCIWEKGDEPMIDLLLKYNADVTLATGNGFTPADLADGRMLKELGAKLRAAAEAQRKK